ncbi:hypothetical protein [Agreia bicolorata]|nr:hypothetical protein [Agreia bicolorata]
MHHHNDEDAEHSREVDHEITLAARSEFDDVGGLAVGARGSSAGSLRH